MVGAVAEQSARNDGTEGALLDSLSLPARGARLCDVRTTTLGQQVPCASFAVKPRDVLHDVEHVSAKERQPLDRHEGRGRAARIAAELDA
jgi:hypothetical protein